MPYVVIEVTGLNEALRELQGLISAVKNRAVTNQLIGEYVLDFFTNDVYESQGNAFGHPWPEVSMPYAYYKTKKWGPQLTLVASGQMRASNVLFTTGEMITIKNVARGKNGEYYAYKHQMGGPNLPQRVLMDLDEEHKTIIGDMILDDLQRRKNMNI